MGWAPRGRRVGASCVSASEGPVVLVGRPDPCAHTRVCNLRPCPGCETVCGALRTREGWTGWGLRRGSEAQALETPRVAGCLVSLLLVRREELSLLRGGKAAPAALQAPCFSQPQPCSWATGEEARGQKEQRGVTPEPTQLPPQLLPPGQLCSWQSLVWIFSSLGPGREGLGTPPSASSESP